VADTIVETYKNSGKLLLCGNGGSAADAQHIAAELSGRFYINRPPLNAEALHVNSSFITAIANDFSFNEVYSRSVEAFGKKGDVLIAISTSGNSENIIQAAIKAKEMGIIVVGFTGDTGGKLKDYCSYLLNVPSKITPRIQEAHILIGHIICEIVENNLFSKE
jgi:D-sedoheptulose 7-phosphate isomerase